MIEREKFFNPNFSRIKHKWIKSNSASIDSYSSLLNNNNFEKFWKNKIFEFLENSPREKNFVKISKIISRGIWMGEASRLEQHSSDLSFSLVCSQISKSKNLKIFQILFLERLKEKEIWKNKMIPTMRRDLVIWNSSLFYPHSYRSNDIKFLKLRNSRDFCSFLLRINLTKIFGSLKLNKMNI